MRIASNLVSVQNILRTYIENRKHEKNRINTIQEITGVDVSTIKKYISEIKNNSDFIETLRAEYRKNCIYKPSKRDFMYSESSGSMFFPYVTLYVLTRILKPEIIVETGGTPGKSSAFILQAMAKNKNGKLYTIDLPPSKSLPPNKLDVNKTHEYLPEGKDSGWLVPDNLKDRYNLIKGPSSVHLKPLLDSLEKIDIFIHDSDHSYENMIWEFRTAWPYIKKSGLLLSDDIKANNAFLDFCGEVEAKLIVKIANYGVIVKK
ncbi:MAG: class I SAM-dependent methyltransferase [Methanosarcinales archaeon]